MNIITDRLTRLEEKDQTRASHSCSRSPQSRSRSRSRYSGSPFSRISRENSRARSQYSSRESHSRYPVSSRHFREPLSSQHYYSRRPHPDNQHSPRSFWRSPNSSRKPKLPESSDYSSDSSDSYPHYSREKRRCSSPSEEDSFRDGGETWIKFKRGKHKHVKGDSSQIFWGKDLISVKWFKGPIKAFCQIKSKPSTAPYMDKSDACSHL